MVAANHSLIIEHEHIPASVASFITTWSVLVLSDKNEPKQAS